MRIVDFGPGLRPGCPFSGIPRGTVEFEGMDSVRRYQRRLGRVESAKWVNMRRIHASRSVPLKSPFQV